MAPTAAPSKDAQARPSHAADEASGDAARPTSPAGPARPLAGGCPFGHGASHGPSLPGAVPGVDESPSMPDGAPTGPIASGRLLRRADVAAPPAPWFWGHHPAFVKGKCDFIAATQRDFGDAVPLRFGPVKIWLVSDPALVGEVLTTRAALFQKDMGIRRLKVIVGNGLLSSEGDEHARRSRIAQPAFRQQEIESYGAGMVELTRRIVSSWKEGQRIVVAHETGRLALAIVARALFGADLLGEANELGRALDELFPLMAERFNMAVPLPLWIPTPYNRRFTRALGLLDRTVMGMIREKRAALARGEPSRDLLTRLLAPPADGGAPLTDQELRDEVMTLFLAGHETTANGLAFTLRLLAENPEALALARAEVDAVLGDRPATAQDAVKLERVAATFQEALRIYPPAWVMGREAKEELALGGRVLVEKGAIVMMPPIVLHRDARWFPDPMAFRPERFLRGAPRPTPFSYIPFGAGKRACIGRSFAMLEGTLLTAEIIRAVDLEIDCSRPLAVHPHVTLRPEGGIPAVVRKRRG